MGISSAVEMTGWYSIFKSYKLAFRKEIETVQKKRNGDSVKVSMNVITMTKESDSWGGLKLQGSREIKITHTLPRVT
jgi:hypothetical protein